MTAAGKTGAVAGLLGAAGVVFHRSLSVRFEIASAPVLLIAAILAAMGLGLCLGDISGRQVISGYRMIQWRIAGAAGQTAMAMLLLIGLSAFLLGDLASSRHLYLDLVFVSFFGGCIGFAELTQRYTDDPGRLFGSLPTVAYVCVNMAAAVAALDLVIVFDVFPASAAHREIYEVLTAGFGSIAFFRSSLFTARVGDKDVDVGPSTLLKSLLETSDREINRWQAIDRVDDLATVMSDVDFAKAKVVLPMLCFRTVENVPREQQAQMATVIVEIAAEQALTDKHRSIILGSKLISIVGPVVLDRAVKALGGSIKNGQP